MQIKIFFSYCVFDANMADHSKVKLLPMFRSAEVQKSKAKDLQRKIFSEQIIGDEPSRAACEYTCDSWPYKVCKVFPSSSLLFRNFDFTRKL